MITNEILPLIPQREPFVMIDMLLHAEEGKATCAFTVRNNNIFCENGYFSEAGLLENMAQTVAAGNGYAGQKSGIKNSIRYIVAVKNFEVFLLPAVNDLLITETVVTNTVFNMTTVAGQVTCNQKLVARCEMKVWE